ncbi:MAG: SDR family oxidoreductase [Planctomycetota bacterium]
MTTLVTGSTGYLGGYVTAGLLAREEPVLALVRARDPEHARARLWETLQLHLAPARFWDALESGQLRPVLGDVRAQGLASDPEDRSLVLGEVDGIVHAAATLNRRSSRACADVNLRGALAVARLGQDLAARGHLRRVTWVSTVAVAGRRRAEVVTEDRAIEWERSDFDPYARTKKFGEHLARELLPAGSLAIVRPSIVLGDSRFPDTTQFDMVRAFVRLAQTPLLPFDPEARLDIVPADFVGGATVALHLAPRLEHDTYHLASGADSPRFREITDALSAALGRRRPRFAPRLTRPCARALELLAQAGPRPVRRLATLLDVFWPYLEWDVVFDNARVRAATGLVPTPFPRYCAGLFRYALEHEFRYPARPLPPRPALAARP